MDTVNVARSDSDTPVAIQAFSNTPGGDCSDIPRVVNVPTRFALGSLPFSTGVFSNCAAPAAAATLGVGDMTHRSCG